MRTSGSVAPNHRPQKAQENAESYVSPQRATRRDGRCCRLIFASASLIAQQGARPAFLPTPTPEQIREEQVRANTLKVDPTRSLDTDVVFAGDDLCVNFRFENRTGKITEIYEPDAFLAAGLEEFFLVEGKEKKIDPGERPFGGLIRPERSLWISAGEVITRRVCSFDDTRGSERFFLYRTPGKYRLRNQDYRKSVDYEVVAPIVQATARVEVGMRVVSAVDPDRVAPAHRTAAVLEYQSHFYVVLSMHDVTGDPIPLVVGEALTGPVGLNFYRRVAVEEGPVENLHFAGTSGVDLKLVWGQGPSRHSVAVPASGQELPSTLKPEAK